jgi:hypothetical protein
MSAIDAVAAAEVGGDPLPGERLAPGSNDHRVIEKAISTAAGMKTIRGTQTARAGLST